jgi:predicted N-acetyltransferase YhbS
MAFDTVERFSCGFPSCKERSTKEQVSKGGVLMEVRTERAGDHEEVFQLNFSAFGNREDESRLVDAIRLSGQFIPELSLVAEEHRRLAGHALFSKAEVVDGNMHHEVVVLAPIAVKPSEQKRGIGGRLIQEGLKRCATMGYELVFLIGHPTYYPKFGFKPARAHGFELKQFQVSDDVFMVCELKEGAVGRIRGELMYPPSFF